MAEGRSARFELGGEFLLVASRSSSHDKRAGGCTHVCQFGLDPDEPQNRPYSRFRHRVQMTYTYPSTSLRVRELFVVSIRETWGGVRGS